MRIDHYRAQTAVLDRAEIRLKRVAIHYTCHIMPSDSARATNAIRPLSLVTSSGERVAQHYAEQLSSPLPIDHVEEIEADIKSMWRNRLCGPRMKARDAKAFVEFFRTIGFTYKYKPYGVKIASPFGYCIFDLKQGQGFSFQIHSKPKLEAFHVLSVKPGGFVFVCSQSEWERDGLTCVQRWTRGDTSTLACPYAWFPFPGDTIVIADCNVVHSAVGCVIEEYANCSTDAVVRLYDQNERKHSDYLPQSHPSVAQLLNAGHAEPPTHSVSRDGSSWRSSQLDEGGPIIDVAHRIQGQRLKLSKDQTFAVAAKTNAVTTLICVRGSLECLLCGVSALMAPGDIVTIPPGWGATLHAGQPATLAVHSVAPGQIFQDWG